jgi:two-component system, NarL family, nitrate/nitrite response regulator NarL
LKIKGHDTLRDFPISDSKIIRIGIADDHTIFREGLKTLLAGQPDFQVVGEASDGDEACKLVEKLKPDVLLLDLIMPKMHGLDVLKAFSNSPGNVRSILLSGAMEGEEITKAFELGARGVVLKDSATSLLLFKCIHAVMAGHYWIGHQSVASLVETLKQQRNSEKKAAPKNYGLTPREMEIMNAAVSGCSNKEIATQYSISEQTVKHHVTSIFDKLGVYNRLELALFAFHHGLIEK